MARIVDNLLAYLIAQGVVTTAGTDGFIGELTEGGADNIVALDQTGGVSPDRYIPTEEPTIQVTVRNTSYADGWDKINAIFALLHKKNDALVLESGGVDIMSCFALQSPQHIGEDENTRHIFTCNFVFKVRK